ncbi:MAG: hypothetical protein ACRBCI_04325 [Cellvibrionaceae bacterium]
MSQMLTNEFIKSEMLAESYIDNIAVVKKLLKKGKTTECLAVLEKLESSMMITLAVGELYDLKVTN